MCDINEKFFELFRGLSADASEDSNADGQLRVYLDPAKQIYYLLAPESSGKLFRLEFWVDTYAANRYALQRKIQDFVSAHLRTHELVSYYSAIGCRIRNRITGFEDIDKDGVRFRDDIKKYVLGDSDEAQGAEGEVVAKEATLTLPCQCSLSQVAKMLSAGYHDGETCKNRLIIPPVQRGKVWNAARIETLWDSIFRRIPIGALSVRKQANDELALDLLDGQQRATAVALGYDDFPGDDSCCDKARRMDSILWIDLDKDGSNGFGFYVTTASQPWGYAEKSSETKNSLIPLNERRLASEKIVLESTQIKPYPYQLYPVRASAPVPYTLLRQYIEDHNGETSLSEFLSYLRAKKVNAELQKKLSHRFESKNEADSLFRTLCEKIRECSEKYSVFLLDASSVTENDIALYFTRIGKGGVVPTDEELAYSVLKSKLNKEFRDTIEKIHDEEGLASQSRIAHLAIRLFKSLEKDGTFYTGSVFSAVVDMCKDEPSKEGLRERFNAFVKDELHSAVKAVCDNTNTKLTKWHLTRFASERGGDVFLLLMLARRRRLFSGFDIDGIAELIFNYASHTDYAIRKILDEGLQIGLARLLKETYYNVPRLTLPIAPSTYNGLAGLARGALLSWKETHPAAAELLSQGYGGSPYDRALSMLIYACKGSALNLNFNYTKHLGVWSEENCPWDYDHIMPHSTIEKIASESDRVACEWLKNSIGNIAPIPFSINRSLSDSARDSHYPFRVERPRGDEEEQQTSLCVKGDEVAKMWEDGVIAPDRFICATINRFTRIYDAWYWGLGLDKILNFESAFEQDGSVSRIRAEIVKRYDIYRSVKQNFPQMSYYYIAGDAIEVVVPESEEKRFFAAENYITLAVEVDGVEIAICRDRNGGPWEVGLRKRSSASRTEDGVRDTVEALFADGDIADGAINKSTLCPGNNWWYLCEDIADEDDVAQRLVVRLNALFDVWKGRKTNE